MFNIINYLKSDENIDERALKQTLSVDENLHRKKKEVEKMIEAVYEKESHVARKLSRINPKQINSLQDPNGNYNSNNSNNNNNNDIKSKLSFRESKIIVRDIQDADQYLEERTKELQEIKKVAGQIKEISSSMKNNLEEQGRAVDLIDKNVEDTKVNVIKAELEIEEANKISKKQTGDYRCLVYCVLFLLISIILVVLFCFVL